MRHVHIHIVGVMIYVVRVIANSATAYTYICMSHVLWKYANIAISMEKLGS